MAFLNGPGGVLRRSALEAYWSNINGAELTEVEVGTILFGDERNYVPRRPGAAVEGERYFDPTPRNSPIEINTEKENDVVEVDMEVTATEGALATSNPVPPPVASRDQLCLFTRNLLARRAQTPAPARATSS